MSSPIKSIIIIAGNYPYQSQMKLVFVQQLVHALLNMGIKVTVVAEQSLIHSFIHKEKLIPTHYKALTETGIEYDVYRPYTLSFGNCNFFEHFIVKYNKSVITSILKKINSDILYCHFWSAALPVCNFALKNKKSLFVACGEGDNAIENMVAKIPKQKLQKMVSAVSGVISVSSENKRKCIDLGLISEEKIGVFPNCVNTDVFHQIDVTDLKQELGITEKDFVIIFVGRFISRKGPDRVAKAITKLNDPNIKVIFVGDPFPGYPYDFDCPGIIYKGPLDHNKLSLYLNCSDVFVMPTQKEGCCNAIVEALAIGLPIISSDGPFNDDILNENNSIRLNPNDVDAIALAIKNLKDNKSLRQSMTDYTLSRHEEYSIKGRAKRIIDFINMRINEDYNKIIIKSE